jgi:hypothetical protein
MDYIPGTGRDILFILTSYRYSIEDSIGRKEVESAVDYLIYPRVEVNDAWIHAMS